MQYHYSSYNIIYHNNEYYILIAVVVINTLNTLIRSRDLFFSQKINDAKELAFWEFTTNITII